MFLKLDSDDWIMLGVIVLFFVVISILRVNRWVGAG
jgi:hypothetical protein